MNSKSRQYPQDFLMQAPILDQKYRLLLTLGSVHRVKMGVNLSNNQRVAIKIMKAQPPFSQQLVDSFLNEVRTLVRVKHHALIQIKDFSVDGCYRRRNGQQRKILYYVMKLAQNGQLLKLIQETDNLGERLVRYYFRQLIQGIQYLHSNGIAHRDIKAENIVIDSKFRLKIVDFGFSCVYIDKHFKKLCSKEQVGTPQYNAPEVATQYYPDDMDLFSAGCVLFQMLMKSQPFQSTSPKDEYFKKLSNEDKVSYWKIFAGNNTPSKEFKDLVEKMLHHNPNKRIKLEDLKNHPWYKGQVPSGPEIIKEMQQRCKKVNNMIRSEQDAYVKNKIKKYKCKEPVSDCEPIRLQQLSKQIQEEVLQLQAVLKEQESSEGSSKQEEIFVKKE